MTDGTAEEAIDQVDEIEETQRNSEGERTSPTETF
jgi:hypothetical protein